VDRAAGGGRPADLAKRSTRPHNTRPPEKRAPERAAPIAELRSERFAQGRDKICPRLQGLGREAGEAAIGRIIGEHLRKGKISGGEASSAKRQ